MSAVVSDAPLSLNENETTLLNATKEYGEEVKGKDSQVSGKGLVTGPKDMSSKRSRAIKRNELVGTDGIKLHNEEIGIISYFSIQDLHLWEVIENGNSWVPILLQPPESGPSTALKMTVPSTTEEKMCKKNDVKARSLLLMALPNEHQLTFNQYAIPTMIIAIKASFLRKYATKTDTKGLIEAVNNENFNLRAQNLMDSILTASKACSRWAILGVDTSRIRFKFKFLRSLPSEWIHSSLSG
ncbi:hypothetical protein Tco_1355239 [Tanacetum coccineum]